MRGLVKYLGSTAPYVLANALKLFPSSSLNIAIIGMTFSYIVSSFDGSFSLLMCSSGNTSSRLGLDDAMLDKT